MSERASEWASEWASGLIRVLRKSVSSIYFILRINIFSNLTLLVERESESEREREGVSGETDDRPVPVTAAPGAVLENCWLTNVCQEDKTSLSQLTPFS